MAESLKKARNRWFLVWELISLWWYFVAWDLDGRFWICECLKVPVKWTWKYKLNRPYWTRFLPWKGPWDLFQSNTPKWKCSCHFINKIHKTGIQIRSLFVAKFSFLRPPNFWSGPCFYQALIQSSPHKADWFTFLSQDRLAKSFPFLDYFESDIFQRSSVKLQVFKGIFWRLCRNHHCRKRTMTLNFRWTSKTESVYLWEGRIQSRDFESNSSLETFNRFTLRSRKNDLCKR